MLRTRVQMLRAVFLLLALVLVFKGQTAISTAQSNGNPRVIPPNARPYGLTLAQWSAKWWQWGLELPAVAGHPFIDCPDPPDVGQSGPVWFLAGNYGSNPCPAVVPVGKSVFFPIINAECSSLEPFPYHGDTAEEQRVCAKGWADQIDVSLLFCEVDGVPLKNLEFYRFVSPQFAFTAPTPWIFGADGGSGTAVGDGYYIFLTPLSQGEHTIHFGYQPWGINTTFHLTVM